MIKTILIFLILLYILKYNNYKIAIILTLIYLLLKCKKEPYVNYPDSINESIDRVKYENINKKLIKQDLVHTPKTYHKNIDVYDLYNHEKDCGPAYSPTSIHNRNK